MKDCILIDEPTFNTAKKPTIENEDDDSICLKALRSLIENNYLILHDFNHTYGEVFYLNISRDESRLRYSKTCKNYNDSLEPNPKKLIEYELPEVDMLNKCFHNFHQACKKRNIPKHNPIAFYNVLSKQNLSDTQDILLVNILAYALCDVDFLFDCSYDRVAPSNFIRPSQIEVFYQEISKNIKDSKVNVDTNLPKTISELNQVYDKMLQQICEYQLFNTNSFEYQTYFSNKFYPYLIKFQNLFKIFKKWSDAKSLATNNTKVNISFDQVISLLEILSSYLKYKEIAYGKESNKAASLPQKMVQDNISRLKMDYKRGNTISSLIHVYFNFNEILKTIKQCPSTEQIAPVYTFHLICKNFRSLINSENISLCIPPSMLKNEYLLSSTDITARKNQRCNLLLYSQLCDFYSTQNFNYDKELCDYIFQRSYGYWIDNIPPSEVYSNNKQLKQYILKGFSNGIPVYPFLHSLEKRLDKRLNMFPLEILTYSYPFISISNDEFYTFWYANLYEPNTINKDSSNKIKRIKRKTASSKFRNIFKSLLEHYPTIIEDYKNIVLMDNYGLGSGFSTSYWHSSIALFLDEVINLDNELLAIAERTPKYHVLTQLGIHYILMEKIKTETINTALKLAKQFLYSSSIMSFNFRYDELNNISKHALYVSEDDSETILKDISENDFQSTLKNSPDSCLDNIKLILGMSEN